VNKEIVLNETKVGRNHPAYIIAEISGNHGGDISKAIEIIKEAKECGVNAIKLQTYTADTITIDSDKEDFIIPKNNPWEDNATLYSLYKEAYTPWEWHEELFEEAKKSKIDIFSSPFDSTAINLLEDLNVKFYKIASPEIFDIGLIKLVAETKKPVIISTGLADRNDIELALETLKQNGCEDIILLKCTTAYPAPFNEVNLRTMMDYEENFNVLSGLSDHSLGTEVPIAAAALGASVIEKHFVLKGDETVDSFFSLSPEEFKEMITKIRNVEKSLGKIKYEVSNEASKNLWARRSLYFIKNLKKGEKIKGSYKSIRPGFGLHPKHFDSIENYIAGKDIEIGDRVDWDSIIEK
tara:strand:- start:277 stop:1332 length:1056 start_codon:yes stop_codon:yes gene_type:complete